MISDLLDMPTDRAAELREWSQALTAGLEPTADLAEAEAAEAASDLMGEYVGQIIEERRRNPGDDLLSALIAVEAAGDRLSSTELLSFVILLYVAGHETTVNLIGNGTLALLRHRSEFERWRADATIGPRAVDELLRYDGPVQLTVRVPTEPVRFAEVDVAAGTTVMCLLGAANHDPDVFDDPRALRLDRPNAARHLAFASGIHYCLGASLARLEAEVAIGTLVRRYEHLDLAAEPGWRDRLTIRGVDRLELSIA
ncbi:MAG: cytochrome P450 [Ilumatobacteraceae bacterium]